MSRKASLAAVVVALLASFLPAQDLLITQGHVITVSGKDLPATDVLIKGGRIVAIGEGLSADAAIPRLDATGRVVMPGYVLAHTSGGVARANEVVPVTPYVAVADGLDPSAAFIEDALRDGILTANIMPGERTVVGGIGRIINPFGLTVEQMTVVADSGLKISFQPPRGSRAAHLESMRSAFRKAHRALAKKELDSDDESTGNVRLDLKALGVSGRQMNMYRALKRDLPVFAWCETSADVVAAMKLEKEYNLDMKLAVGPGAWRAASLLAKRNKPVILSAVMELREKDPETDKMVTRNLPKILRKAGVKFALSTQPNSISRRYAWYQAACLVRWGFSEREALAAVTTEAAAIIGLKGRKGELSKGADGDVLILTEPPLSGRAWVDEAVIGGKVVYRRRDDPRLSEVFGSEVR